MQGLHAEGMTDVPVVAGGILPKHDEPCLIEMGVKATFTPRHTDLNAIMAALVDVIRHSNGLEPFGSLT